MDSRLHELDLLLERHGELWAIEIKLTSSPSPDDLRALDKAADLIEAPHRVLISRVAEASRHGSRLSSSLDYFLGSLEESPRLGG